MKPEQDAFGRALYDAWKGKGRGFHVVEREDGMLDAMESKTYFAPYRRWPGFERRAVRYARGRVLDVGCGAGRHALYLQRRGLDVLATDISPLAIRVCRQRGVRRARIAAATQARTNWGRFDTILMLGNNLGLVENPRRAKWLLRRFYRMTTDRGVVLAGGRDPYWGAPAEHRRYHRWNRQRGRMGGQIRLRVRYRSYATPWLDYLFVSRRELQALLRGTGWHIRRFLPPTGQLYVAVLAKEREDPRPLAGRASC